MWPPDKPNQMLPTTTAPNRPAATRTSNAITSRTSQRHVTNGVTSSQRTVLPAVPPLLSNQHRSTPAPRQPPPPTTAGQM